MVIDVKLKRKIGIYKLTIANHTYVGSSINLYKRLLVHSNELHKCEHDNVHLQRCVNKYGFENLSYKILAILPEENKDLLLSLEKFFIEWEHADLNFKMDPRTERDCTTTSVPVYQFNSFGELIKYWPSISTAARAYNIDSSNIVVCCKNPARQQFAAGYLWAYDKKYKYPIQILYVFDLNGKLLGRYSDTTEIAALFPEVKRKTILSQLRKKVDSSTPYKNIYISTNKEFKIPANYTPRFKEADELDKIFATNPVVYVFNLNNQLQYAKPLFDFDNISYVKRKIKSGKSIYRLAKDSLVFNKRKNKIEAIKDGQTFVFNSAVEAAFKLFGDKYYGRYILKHISRGTKYRDYWFKRVL